MKSAQEIAYCVVCAALQLTGTAGYLIETVLIIWCKYVKAFLMNSAAVQVALPLVYMGNYGGRERTDSSKIITLIC